MRSPMSTSRSGTAEAGLASSIAWPSFTSKSKATDRVFLLTSLRHRITSVRNCITTCPPATPPFNPPFALPSPHPSHPWPGRLAELAEAPGDVLHHIARQADGCAGHSTTAESPQKSIKLPNVMRILSQPCSAPEINRSDRTDKKAKEPKLDFSLKDLFSIFHSFLNVRMGSADACNVAHRECQLCKRKLLGLSKDAAGRQPAARSTGQS